MSSRRAGQPARRAVPHHMRIELLRWGGCRGCHGDALAVVTAIAALGGFTPPLRRWSNSRRWCSQPLSMSRSVGRDALCDRTNKGYFTEDPSPSRTSNRFRRTALMAAFAAAGAVADYDRVRSGTRSLSQGRRLGLRRTTTTKPPRRRETIATFARNWRVDGADSEGTPDPQRLGGLQESACPASRPAGS